MGMEFIKAIGRTYSDSRAMMMLKMAKPKRVPGLEKGKKRRQVNFDEDLRDSKEESLEDGAGGEDSSEASVNRDVHKRLSGKKPEVESEKTPGDESGKMHESMTLREAVIWSEILGPSVGKKSRAKRMERMHGNRSYAGRR